MEGWIEWMDTKNYIFTLWENNNERATVEAKRGMSDSKQSSLGNPATQNTKLH